MPLNHLTIDERCCIAQWTTQGWSKAKIAQTLGRHRGTVYRELERNQDRLGGYHPQIAHQLASKRRTQANKRYRLDSSKLKSVVCSWLGQGWSPEQVAGRLKREYLHDQTMWVSHETIYRWVYRQYQQDKRWPYRLRKGASSRCSRQVGQRLETRGKIPGRVGIEQRPAIVDQRIRLGDWESDTLEGAKGQGLLAVHVERTSRFAILVQLPDKQAWTLACRSCRAFKGLPVWLRHTMTADNGKEFAQFAVMEKRLGLKVYFANPRSPWERGTNENTNGLLRQYFPKGCDLRKVTPAQLANIQHLLNNRPRKCLNYRSPAEVLGLHPPSGVALRI